MSIRLIATDMDGTLLRSDHRTISPRTREAFARARRAGLDVLAISGRQPYSIGALVADGPLDGAVVGSNGSVAMDLPSRTVLFEETLDVDAQRAIVEGVLKQFPDAKVSSVRNAGNVYVTQHGYSGLEDPGADMARWAVSHRHADLDEVLAEPSVKLAILDPEAPSEELLAVARGLGVAGAHPTTSGAPFLEVGRAGVSKATALARFARSRGYSSDEVLAFGDNNNDVEMLAWAGHGVAMGNAVPAALAVADEVTGHHDEDGVAEVIERLLG